MADLGVFQRNKSFMDFQREADAFDYKRAQEAQARAMEQQKFNMAAQEFEMKKQQAAAEQEALKAGGFVGNSIEAQMANRLLKDPHDQIANMYYTKAVTIPNGGIVAVTPKDRGFNPDAMQQPAGDTGVPATVPNIADIIDMMGGQATVPNQAVRANNPQSAGNGLRVLREPTAGRRKLSATEQKEFFEAQDIVNSAPNIMDALNQALELNKTAYSGALANERAWLNSNIANSFGEENAAANATVNLKNIVQLQALENLKAIFGSMPTEGERKVLLEMQASTEKTPQQREDILRRAMVFAQRRIDAANSKMQGIATGSVYSGGQVQPMAAAPQNAQSDGNVINWEDLP